MTLYLCLRETTKSLLTLLVHLMMMVAVKMLRMLAIATTVREPMRVRVINVATELLVLLAFDLLVSLGLALPKNLLI